MYRLLFLLFSISSILALVSLEAGSNVQSYPNIKIKNNITNDKKQRQLAILIAAPWKNESAMHNDLLVMQETLVQRGFSKNNILSLEGYLTRKELLDFLVKAQQEISNWKTGNIFFYYSGHGFYTGDSASTAQAGLQLNSTMEDTALVYWHEVFAILKVPSEVKLILLPDC